MQLVTLPEDSSSSAKPTGDFCWSKRQKGCIFLVGRMKSIGVRSSPWSASPESKAGMPRGVGCR